MLGVDGDEMKGTWKFVTLEQGGFEREPQRLAQHLKSQATYGIELLSAACRENLNGRSIHEGS
jgi:hypothetical protein